MRICRYVLMLVGVVMLVSCEPADSSSGGSMIEGWDALHNRLRECGIMSEGRLPREFARQCYSGLTPDREKYYFCLYKCLSELDCSVLDRAYCDEDSDFGQLMSLCDSECIGSLICDGQTYGASADFVCDGEEDCADGADEAGCSTFSCGSGEVVLARLVCNSSEDCEDGSDELGCPGFLCADGTFALYGVECNGEVECSDRSDEDDCPVFTCGDGTTVFWGRECDEVVDCPDGSDETGCAVVICQD